MSWCNTTWVSGGGKRLRSEHQTPLKDFSLQLFMGPHLEFLPVSFLKEKKEFSIRVAAPETSIRRDRRKHEASETSGAFERRPLYPQFALWNGTK